MPNTINPGQAVCLILLNFAFIGYTLLHWMHIVTIALERGVTG